MSAADPSLVSAVIFLAIAAEMTRSETAIRRHAARLNLALPRGNPGRRRGNNAEPQLAFGYRYRPFRGHSCSYSAVRCRATSGLKAKGK
jgi:hypothetical protein